MGAKCPYYFMETCVSKEIKDILNCKDLYVLLTNNNGKFNYLESYRLTNVFYSDNQYWGKFSNVHAAIGHNDIKSNQPLSYAYNNFSSVVCTSGLTSRTKRFFSANTYRSMEFKTRGLFTEVWSMASNGPILGIYQAVKSGCRMKVKIESHDNTVYILSLHTIEVDIDEGLFFAETEYDGYPEELRQVDQIRHIESLFNDAQEKSGISSPSTNYCENSDFFLTSFRIYSDHLLHRFVDGKGDVKDEVYKAKNVSIWQESNSA